MADADQFGPGVTRITPPVLGTPRAPLTSDQIARGCRYVMGDLVCSSDGAGGGMSAGAAGSLMGAIGGNAASGVQAAGVPLGVGGFSWDRFWAGVRDGADAVTGLVGEAASGAAGAAGSGLWALLLPFLPWIIAGIAVLFLLLR